MVQMTVQPSEPTSPHMVVSNMSDQDLARKAAAQAPYSTSSSSAPTSANRQLFASGLPPPLPSCPDPWQQRSVHPLLKSQPVVRQVQPQPQPQPQVPSPAPPPRPPSDHPLLSSGGPSSSSLASSSAPSSPSPPEQSSDHPLLSSSSGRHGRSTGPPTAGHGRQQQRHSRSGSVGAALPMLLPPRSGRRNARANNRSHRRVHSLPSAGVAARKDGRAEDGESSGDAGRSMEELATKLEERRRRYGDVHPRVGLAHNSIGTYHFRGGDLSAAAKSYSDALECFKAAADYGSDSSSTSSSSSSGSSSGGSSSSSSSAADLRRQLDVAVALVNLGAVLWSTGKVAEAVESLEKGIEIRGRIDAIKARDGVPLTEKDAEDMSNALYSLGLALSLRGEYDRAMDALDGAETSLLSRPESGAAARGVEGGSPSSSRRVVELARIDDARGKVHLLRGDAASALKCHLRALESKSSAAAGQGPTHPSVLSTRTNIAAVHRAMGDLDEAATLYREVLSARKVALYKESDAEMRRRISADIGATVRAMGEVQRERTNKAPFRGGGSTANFMASIVEEREKSMDGMGLEAKDDWGLSKPQI